MTREIREAVDAIRDKLGEDVLVLDLRGLCDFTDWFVITHGSSDRQVAAIADAVEDRLETACRRSPRHVEGRRVGEWVLLDYYDFVVHVFLDERRRFFGLERLWGDAPRVELEPQTTRRKAPARKRRA